MLAIERQLEAVKSWSQHTQQPVLSVYVDVDPAKTENAGRAWVTRVKNALSGLPGLRDVHGKHDQPMFARVMSLLEAERPSARTMALFACRDDRDGLHAERLDLQVELPVVDVAGGRVDVRYGKPYLTPLALACDEYARTGVLLLKHAGSWEFLEVFLGEARRDDDVLAEIAPDAWQTLEEAGRRIASQFRERAGKPGGRYDKLAPSERLAARLATWTQKLYVHLARLVERAMDRLAIERLVLLGDPWQVSHFEAFLSRRVQQRLIARMPPLPPNGPDTPAAIWRHVEPVVIELERREEMQLLERVKEQGGLWGAEAVLDAVQLGRVRTWVLPWSPELKVYRCPADDTFAATAESARRLCDEPVEVALREHVLELAGQYGADLEFVRGAAERRLMNEMGGMAAQLRW